MAKRITLFRELEVYEAIHQFHILYGRGATSSDVVKMTGLSRQNVAKYVEILEMSNLIERDAVNRSAMLIKGGFKTIWPTSKTKVPDELRDGRKARALRDRMTYEQRVEAARKGLSRRKDRRATEEDLLEQAVKYAKEREAGNTAAHGADYLRNQTRGAIRAWKVG